MRDSQQRWHEQLRPGGLFIYGEDEAETDARYQTSAKHLADFSKGESLMRRAPRKFPQRVNKMRDAERERNDMRQFLLERVFDPSELLARPVNDEGWRNVIQNSLAKWRAGGLSDFSDWRARRDEIGLTDFEVAELDRIRESAPDDARQWSADDYAAAVLLAKWRACQRRGEPLPADAELEAAMKRIAATFELAM